MNELYRDLRIEAQRLQCWVKPADSRGTTSAHRTKRHKGPVTKEPTTVTGQGAATRGKPDGQHEEHAQKANERVCFRYWEKGHYATPCSKAVVPPPPQYRHLKRFEKGCFAPTQRQHQLPRPRPHRPTIGISWHAMDLLHLIKFSALILARPTNI